MPKICVLGLGYIGLPTACILANNGYDVLGIDINEEIINKLNSGSIHIDEPDLKKIFFKAFSNKKLKISKHLEKSDVFIISVPTPLDNKKADLSYIINAVNMINDYIEKKNLVILESTSPPGTTENIVGEIIFKNKGLKAGIDYYLAFCPERVLPGKLIYELINNDRVIGGINKESAERAKNIYKSFARGKFFLTDLKTAEFVKLAENTYRDINLAFSNELALICDDYNINIWDVIKIANKHPRVKILNPGPGVGGHCIPIDPWFILESSKYRNTLIEKSREINERIPFAVVEKILSIIKGIKKPKVTLFGATYKENVDDIRESPTIVIAEELLKKGIKVSIHDPVANNFKYSLSDLEDSLKESNLVVLLVGHDSFREISFDKMSEYMKTKNILDTRNFYNKKKSNKFGFNYFSI